MRLASGDILAAYVGTRKEENVLFVELHALLRGMILVEKLGCRKVSIYMDSLLAVLKFKMEGINARGKY